MEKNSYQDPFSHKEGSFQKQITTHTSYSGIYCSNAEAKTSVSNAVRFYMLKVTGYCLFMRFNCACAQTTSRLLVCSSHHQGEVWLDTSVVKTSCSATASDVRNEAYWFLWTWWFHGRDTVIHDWVNFQVYQHVKHTTAYAHLRAWFHLRVSCALKFLLWCNTVKLSSVDVCHKATYLWMQKG